MKYLIVETWNGEGYSEENFITEIIELKNDAEAMAHCMKLATENQQPCEVTKGEDSAQFNKGDDDGAYHFFTLTDDAYAVVILCNINTPMIFTKEQYEAEIGKADPSLMEDAKNGDGRHFFGAGDLDDDYDTQFEIINRNPKPTEEDLEWFDGGDGVEYEVWKHADGRMFKVPIEIVRNFDEAEEVDSLHQAKFG